MATDDDCGAKAVAVIEVPTKTTIVARMRLRETILMIQVAVLLVIMLLIAVLIIVGIPLLGLTHFG